MGNNINDCCGAILGCFIILEGRGGLNTAYSNINMHQWKNTVNHLYQFTVEISSETRYKIISSITDSLCIVEGLKG